MVNADDAKIDKVRALDEKYNVRLAPLFERLAGTRAMGGPVTAGKPYLVGESGPEFSCLKLMELSLIIRELKKYTKFLPQEEEAE